MSAVAGTVEQAVAAATITTPRGSSTAVVREQAPVATVADGQGPAGPPGVSAAAPKIYAINGVASFTAAHGLPFAPETWVVAPNGERIDTDTLHAPGATTLMFSQPFTGTLYLR